MAKSHNYPNLSWGQFDIYNDNQTHAFETMCGSLFKKEFLESGSTLHRNPNNAGVEVLPVLEAPHSDGSQRRRISYQAKYFKQTSIPYGKIKDSAEKAVKYFRNELDLIYLFCNKIINTNNPQYKAIEGILAEAGIAMQAISDEDIFDLLRENRDIADYYFRNRDKPEPEEFVLINEKLTIRDASFERSASSEIRQDNFDNADFIRELIAEKIETCRTYIFSMSISDLQEELDRILSHDLTGWPEAKLLYFYHCLVLIYQGDISDSILQFDDYQSAEINWLTEFYNKPRELNAEELLSHSQEVGLLAIDKLFKERLWENIISLFESIPIEKYPEIRNQVALYRGLSLFNTQNYELASNKLRELYKRTNEQRVKLYCILSDIQAINSSYMKGVVFQETELEVFLRQLDEMKETKPYLKEEALIALVRMQSAYHLGFKDRRYFEQAVADYAYYSQETKDNYAVKYYYALCQELIGNRKEAANIYLSLGAMSCPSITERYMVCCVNDDQSDKAIEVYQNLPKSARSTGMKGIYLLALANISPEKYVDTMRDMVDEARENLDDLVTISTYMDIDYATKDILLPAIVMNIEAGHVDELPFLQRAGLVAFLASMCEVLSLERVLQSIPVLSALNQYALNEIYKALFSVSNNEYNKQGNGIVISKELESTEHIADRFLKENVSRDRFLQIKVLCSGAKHMPFSMLKYSKELFVINQDEATARNIVAILLERNDKKQAEYYPYLDMLENSEQPEHCMIAAFANLILGKADTAEYLAYKAIYFLNGEDNETVYKQYFGFCGMLMLKESRDVSLKTIKGSVVVTLESDDASLDHQIRTICIDSEADFFDPANRSMGIEHLISTDPDAIKLRGSGLRQKINLTNRSYTIVRIIPRSEYCKKYIFEMIQKKPNYFDGAAKVFELTDSKNTMRQLKEYVEETAEYTKSALKAYHFVDNELGLPIDVLVGGNYDRYIDAVKSLLFTPNEAFYAGEPIYEYETGQKYIPTLSTLVLLSIFDQMQLLDGIREDILIPQSYIQFFTARYSKAKDLYQNSKGTLSVIDGQLIIQKADQKASDIWEGIIRFCKKAHVAEVSDEERIGFSILNNFSGEQLMSAFKIDLIQLDAMVVAKREAATLLSDDLFLRKLARTVSIRSLNFVSLLEHYTDADYRMPIILELSKTNYIYVPLMARNDEEAKELQENLLHGELKKKYYGAALRRLYSIREKIMRELLGENYEDYIREK